MKKFLWLVLGIALVGWILYSNMQEQKEQSDGKQTVYAIFPLTGQIAQYGKDMQKTIELYMKQNNPPFQVKFLDSESISSKAVSAFQQATLNDEHPIVISLPSHISSALAPIVEKKNGFLFGIATLTISTNAHNFQRISRCVKDEIEPLSHYILSHYKTVGIAYTQDDHGLKDFSYLKESLADSNVKIAQEVILSTTERDVKNEATKLIAHQPEAIVVLGQATQSYINIIKELKKQGYTGQIMAECSLTNPPTFKAVGDYANDLIVSTMSAEIEIPQPKRVEELKANLKQFGIPTYFLTIEAIDTLDLISYTIKNNLPFSQKTYEDMKNWSGIAGDIEFTGSGDAAVLFYQLAKIKDGHVLPVLE